MNIASLIVLDWLVVSLCIMLKLSASIGCPVVVLCRWMGEGALKCSLILSPNALPDSPMYVVSQLMCGHWYWYMIPVWFVLGSLSLGLPKAVLRVLVPLK